MALIQCPECGRKNISDTAETCPSCGFKVHDYILAQERIRQEAKEAARLALENDKIAVQVSLLYKKEFQLECTLKVMGEDYYIWVEDTFLYNADEATDKELGSGRTCSLKITSSGELKINERGTLYYLTRG